MNNTTYRYFAELDPAGFLVQTHHVPAPADADAEQAEPDCALGHTLVELAQAFVFDAPSESSRARLVDGKPTWVETATLAELKARQNAAINRARLAANRACFHFAGKDIACDEASLLELQCVNGEICLTGQVPARLGGGWKAIDNSYVALPDVAAWTAFYQAMVQAGLANFRKSQNLKLALQEADTPASVLAVEW